MKRINTIVDYDPFCGGLSAGIEDGKNFVVKKNLALNKKNYLTYNDVHLLGYEWEEDISHIDVFTAVPDFGDYISRRGAFNFNMDQLNECLAYISLHQPDRVVIAVCQSAITYLQIAGRVVYSDSNIPSVDLIISLLDKIGYSVRYDIIDIATYRVPQHKIIAFYVGVKKSLISEGKMRNFRFPKSDNEKEVSVMEWLSAIDDFRTMNFHDLDYRKRDNCAMIKPGKSAADTKELSTNHGYIRMKPDCATKMLGPDYYLVSSSYPSIHPIKNRPLSVREGALLSGFFDDYRWDPKLSKKDVAAMVFKSVSPMIGEYVRRGLLNMII